MKLLPNLQFKKTFLTGLTLAIVFSVVGIATAQEIQRTFTVINPRIDVEINPGGYTEGKTAVINETDTQLTFKLTVQDYIVVDSKGTPNLLPPGTLNSKYSAASWIAVSPASFTLKPKQRQDISYYIQAPKAASACGHYAAIVYTPSSSGNAGTGATVTGQVGALFAITIKGECNENATVTKFTTNPFQEYGPVKILTQIKNNGDIHIRPEGTITLSGLFANYTVKFKGENIFPETTRDVVTSAGKTLMLGPYKANFNATYGTTKLPLSASVYFWVFPWRIALLIILVLVALILGYMYYKRRKGAIKPQQSTITAEKPSNEAGETVKQEEQKK